MSAKTLLAVDFSTSFRSIAIMETGTGNVLARMETLPCPEEGEGICSCINQLLSEAGLSNQQIQAVALGAGPGSYTGIRAAIAFAQGWHLAQGIKLASVSTADALAMRAFRQGWQGKIHILIDAQRHEYYHGAYQAAPGSCFPTPVEELQIISSQAAQALLEETPLVGGPDLQKSLPQVQPLYPLAEDIATLALKRNTWCAPEDLVPIYLRPTEFVKAAPFRTLPL